MESSIDGSTVHGTGEVASRMRVVSASVRAKGIMYVGNMVLVNGPGVVVVVAFEIDASLILRIANCLFYCTSQVQMSKSQTCRQGRLMQYRSIRRGPKTG